MAHRGGHSVKVHGGGVWGQHAFVQNKAIASLGSKVYGRFWMRLESGLPQNHTTFAVMYDETDGDDLRIGGQFGYLLWNRQNLKGRGPTDETLPRDKTSANTIMLQSGVWTCVEFAIDGEQGTLRTWVDGDDSKIPGVQVDGIPTPGLDDWFLETDWHPRKLTDLRLGWECYSGDGANTVWFDDVALGTARIGCN